MKRPKVLVLRTAGTNCDQETAFAFSMHNTRVSLVHINQIIYKKIKLSDFHILAIPGGFTYGDDIASGKILANQIRFELKNEFDKFIKDGKLIIGICNGFQVLVKAGLLPGRYEVASGRNELIVTLSINDSGRFEDRWVYLRNTNYEMRNTKCVWTKDLPQIIYLPVAHGEGKFIPNDETTLHRLKENNQVVFQYADKRGRLLGYPHNPNGSVDNIAGICDTSGRIFGLMPHPERHMLYEQNPYWTASKAKKEADGMAIFRNGVEFARRLL